MFLGLHILVVLIDKVTPQKSEVFELILNETEDDLETEPVTATLPDLTTQTIKSPTSAYFLPEPPKTRIHNTF